MTDPQTPAQIAATAKSAEQAISTLQRQLQTEQRTIRDEAFFANRALTQKEESRLADIASAQKKLSSALIKLALVNLQTLDNSDQVKKLRRSMRRINNGLASDLDKLTQIEAASKTIAKVADVVAKVTAQVAALAAA